jgi:hypothetical protein
VTKTACLVLFLLLSAAGYSQTRKGITISRSDAGIILDGKLNDSAWASATSFSQFMQSFPNVGAKPSERTVARMLYTNEYLYIGVQAFDSFPGKIRSSALSRDKLLNSDDGVFIMLDTWNDKSHALLVYSNTNGARFDEEVIGNDGFTNSAFNTYWDVAPSINDSGYCLEFRIPISSLRFQQRDSVSMGLRVIRQIGRKNEFDIYPACDPTISNMNFRVNTSQEISFTELKSKRPVYFSPYVNVSYSQASKLNPATQQYELSSTFMKRNKFLNNPGLDKVLSGIGGDLKYGITKNLTLDATFNTDFAQVEIDNRVLNLSRFGINLPEKRNFFLEGNDALSYTVTGNIILFNSRSIGIENGQAVPIVAGARLTGKANGWQVGALNIQTAGVEAYGIEAQNYTVLRTRKDLFGNGSFVGGFFSNKVSTSSAAVCNQVVALDFYHRMGDKWVWGVSLAATHDKGERWLRDDNMVANVFVSKSARTGFFHVVSVDYVQKNFNPGIGFTYDAGFMDLFTSQGHTWEMRKTRKLRFLDLFAAATVKWRGTAGSYLESYDLQPVSLQLRFRSGFSFSTYPLISRDSVSTRWYLPDGRAIEPSLYKMAGLAVNMKSAVTKTYGYSLTATAGGFYGGSRLLLDPKVSFNVNKHLELTAGYTFTHIDFPGEGGPALKPYYESHLVSFQGSYDFNTHVSLKALIQYDNISKTLASNLRFRFNPKEGTDFYLVYTPVLNTNFREFQPTQPFINRQNVTAKFTKTFDLAR